MSHSEDERPRDGSGKSAELHFNHQYLLGFAERQKGNRSSYRILDYGCGAAEVVLAGRERGMDFQGAEVFYAGGSTRDLVAARHLLGSTVREIRDGRLDFADASFDLVVNNQVLEHARDLDQVLAELHRVLKPGGKVLSLFPTRELWREGHCGIPFLHWFAKESRLRYGYALALRRLGLGYHKGTKSPSQWAAGAIQWIDNYCFYRSRRSLLESFACHFTVTPIEEDYISLRLQAGRLAFLAPLVHLPLLRSAARVLFRKLGGLVILGTKPEIGHGDA